MSAAWLLVAALVAPIMQGLASVVLARAPIMRDGASSAFAFIAAAAALALTPFVVGRVDVDIAFARPLPGVPLAFAIEPIGVIAGAMIAALGALRAVYGAGLAREIEEERRGAMLGLSALANAAALACVYAANLLTFFIAFEILSLCLFALAAQSGGEESRRAVSRRSLVGLALSFGLILPAMALIYSSAGSLSFDVGGVFGEGQVSAGGGALLAVLVIGIVQGAATPGALALSQRSNADAAMLTLTHATTAAPVVVAGVAKLSFYLFADALAEAAVMADALIIAAGAGACAAAFMAMARDDLFERIAYASLTQTLLAVGGALAGSLVGVFGAMLQVLTSASASAAMLMGLGAAAIATGRRSAASWSGLGRATPWLVAGFVVSAASLVGMAPFAGGWAKLALISAAAERHDTLAAVLVGLAAALTFAHLAPFSARALSAHGPKEAFKRPDGGAIALLAPMALASGACLALTLIANLLFNYLSLTLVGAEGM